MKFPLNSLWFEDVTARVVNKAPPIKGYFGKFYTKLTITLFFMMEYYYLLVDGKFSWKMSLQQYMKFKPDKYGIKLYPVVDATTF